MTQYRYQLEKYRGRSTRHVCPQCGRKNVFTRYVDTENNNIYISDNVGKCNRLDKCGYHYTPHQYFTDNPWKRDDSCLFVRLHRENKQTNKRQETKETQGTKERSRTMTADSIIGSRQPLIQTSLLSLLSLSSLSSQKKVFTRYVIVENNNIYISDIIISIIYTTLITHGSEIRRGRKSVRSFFFIGKTNERTTNFHPSPRGYQRGCRVGYWRLR